MPPVLLLWKHSWKLLDPILFFMIYLVLAVLGLHCCLGFSLVAVSRSYSLVVLCRLLIVAASLVVKRWFQVMWASVLQHMSLVVAAPGSRVVVTHWLSCCSTCGIFPDQGLNLYLWHWQADSLPASHQGSPYFWEIEPNYFFSICILISPAWVTPISIIIQISYRLQTR